MGIGIFGEDYVVGVADHSRSPARAAMGTLSDVSWLEHLNVKRFNWLSDGPRCDRSRRRPSARTGSFGHTRHEYADADRLWRLRMLRGVAET